MSRLYEDPHRQMDARSDSGCRLTVPVSRGDLVSDESYDPFLDCLPNPMTVRLHEPGVTHARGLLRRGEITHDTRDDWSEHAPSTSQSNAFIDKHGMAEYAKWHLAEDTEKTAGTRGRYLFPYGDFTKLHRCAVISGESRAGQNNYTTVSSALKDLLEGIDTK